MRKTARAIALIVAALGTTGSAMAQSNDECDWREPIGSCSASLTVNRDNNTYRVGANADCARVTIYVDNTAYEHKFTRAGSELDNITVFDKKKPYAVSTKSCETYPTKQQLIDKCTPVLLQAIAPCRAQRLALNAACSQQEKALVDSGEDGTAFHWTCWSQTQDATQGCYSSAADQGNSCLKANYYYLFRAKDYIGVGNHGTW